MNTLPMHDRAEPRLDAFNGPILDHEKLRQGTYVALMTTLGSVVLVLAVKALYAMF